jgi:hypothetical protein
MNHPEWRAWIRRGLLAVSVLAAVLAGCGGGVGSGGTGSFASGPITGFGSVIVNDVRFEIVESQVRVEDADGTARTSDALRLGMTVEIDASAIASTATGLAANASRIHYESVLLGAVDAVDAGSGNFTLLGQRVAVDASTVFDERLVAGLDALRAQPAVEVYGVYDAAAQRYRATRIEPAAATGVPRLRGVVAAVDPTAGTLRIGATAYRYAGAAGVPAALAAGQFVRLSLGAAAPWTVLSFGAPLSPLPDGDDVKLKGLITTFASSASFSVDGRPVDAGSASFPDGRAGLAVGVRVAVEGAARAGILRASEVSIKSDEQERDHGYELHGAITSVNAAQQSFVLRGQTVSTVRPDLRYRGGNAADLQAGAAVEVQGLLSADGLRIEATVIQFD